MARPGVHMRRMQFKQWIPVDVEQVFLFFADPRNLPRIMPPASGTNLIETRLVPPLNSISQSGTVENIAGVGSEIVTSFRLLPCFPFRAKWIARITEFEWNYRFADMQVKGPFKHFQHRHEFAAMDRGAMRGTSIRDVIEYQVGYALLGAIADKLWIEPTLKRTFSWRQRAVKEIFGPF